MPAPVTDRVTHYTKAPDTLFQSISAQPLDEAEAVRGALVEANTLAYARVAFRVAAREAGE